MFRVNLGLTFIAAISTASDGVHYMISSGRVLFTATSGFCPDFDWLNPKLKRKSSIIGSVSFDNLRRLLQ